MTLRHIAASFSCDGCGRDIDQVYLDPALEISGASLHDVAEEALRDNLFTTIQAEMHLCEKCTKIADAIGEEDHRPTRDEITEAIEDAERIQESSE